MSRISYEKYGRLALQCNGNYTEAVARYQIQKEAERRIVPDISQKLDLRPGDSVLEIGCGPGTLAIPITFLAAHVTVVDHPDCLKAMERRFPHAANVVYIPGNFLDIAVPGEFDRILCYSVLHYLSNEAEMFRFMDKALALLTRGGRALFGDIPNRSLKQRFLGSASGQAFSRTWEELRGSENEAAFEVERDMELLEFNDRVVMAMMSRYREAGFNAYVLPQDPSLCCGHTREDLLICSLP